MPCHAECLLVSRTHLLYCVQSVIIEASVHMEETEAISQGPKIMLKGRENAVSYYEFITETVTSVAEV